MIQQVGGKTDRIIWDEHPQPAMDFFDNAQLREKTRRAIDMTKFRLDSPGKL